MLDWRHKEPEERDLSADLKTHFGFDDFKPGQRESVEAALAGRDVFTTLPTSGGKSLIYQQAGILSPRGSTTLVISPLIALMRDQLGHLDRMGIPSGTFNSGMDTDDRANVLGDLRTGKLCLFYIAPEQLARTTFTDETSGVPFSRVVVDEAHCISEWGHDFRPSYLKIREFADRRKIGQIIALTATATRMVAADIRSSLKLKDPFEFHGELERPNLKYDVEDFSDKESKQRRLIELIKELAPGEKDAVVVYCSTTREVNELAHFLNENDITAQRYHGRMEKHERKDVETRFISDTPRVLVATNAFGMGVDKPNIRLIIHFNIPGNVQSYIQETGRAGRDGEEANCVLLYSPDDLEVQESFLEQKAPDVGFIRKVYDVLVQLRSQQKRRIAGGFFEFEMWKLYERFTLTGKNGRKKYRNTQVNAALDILKTHGIVKTFDAYFQLVDFPKGSPVEEMIRVNAGVREEIARALLQQMVRYAEHNSPSQDLLMGMMDEELRAAA